MRFSRPFNLSNSKTSPFFVCSYLLFYASWISSNLQMRDSTPITESPASTGLKKMWDLMGQKKVREVVIFPSDNVK